MVPAFSFTNYVADAATVITGSSQDANYPDDNIAEPQIPFIPWRTGALGSQNVVIDFGSARKIEIIIFNRTNFASVTIQGNAANSWGSPSFSQAITIGRNRLTGRYQHGEVLSGFNYRYLRPLIADPGALGGETYYLLGGLWAGPMHEAPRRMDWQVTERVLEPSEDVAAASGEAVQHLILGEPWVRLTIPRPAWLRNPDQPWAETSDLAAWADLDRRMREAGPFAYVPREGVASQSYIVRRQATVEWRRRDFGTAESTLVLDESIGP